MNEREVPDHQFHSKQQQSHQGKTFLKDEPGTALIVLLQSSFHLMNTYSPTMTSKNKIWIKNKTLFIIEIIYYGWLTKVHSIQIQYNKQ